MGGSFGNSNSPAFAEQAKREAALDSRERRDAVVGSTNGGVTRVDTGRAASAEQQILMAEPDMRAMNAPSVLVTYSSHRVRAHPTLAAADG